MANITKQDLHNLYLKILPYLGKGGHTIKNASGTSMTDRDVLKFGGDIGTTDDGTNEQTVVAPHELTNAEIADILATTPGPAREGVVYSTDEQKIGVWVDGKPLYQKTITGSDSVANKSNKSTELLSDVDAFVSGDGVIDPDSTHSRSIVQTPINEGNGTAWWATNIILDKSTHKLNFFVSSSGAGAFSYGFTVTVRYTKTTDSAPS